MSHDLISIDELRDRIHKGEIHDPLVFLESVMSGKDLRNLSEIYELVNKIDDLNANEITPADWNAVVELVNSKYKFDPLSLDKSLTAAKTLSEYIYPKRKQVDINDNNTKSVSNTPLTKEEIKLFKRKFNENF